ncbi:MAG TPA: hypothetical protein VLL98_05005 [Rickettsiales bacterium]|nr:hypothetical protein [Rickettsiales bacterium]
MSYKEEVLDFSAESEVRKDKNILGSIKTIDIEGQKGIEKIEVAGQKEQPEKPDLENKGDGKLIWFGIVLGCGFLLIEVATGTAFFVVPLKVGGFAMIPLNKKETHKILSNNIPKEDLKRIEDLLSNESKEKEDSNDNEKIIFISTNDLRKRFKGVVNIQQFIEDSEKNSEKKFTFEKLKEKLEEKGILNDSIKKQLEEIEKEKKEERMKEIKKGKGRGR